MEDILEKIKKNIIEGRMNSEDEGFNGEMAGEPGVMELVQKALDQNISPSEILDKCLNPGMEEVGRRYEEGEYLTPDMLASAECVSEIMKILEPKLVKKEDQRKEKFILATVKDDLHDIGKNIVSTLLKGSGYEVKDLGTSVTPDEIVEEVKQSHAQFVGLSALLTTTMSNMKDVIDKLKEAGLRDKVKVFIGGAPVSKEFAQKIGADFYCEDAFDAIEKLKSA
ncbi:corrinoid protein [bacterium]|nr:corrinoid protein [bacterium]